jgi:uncharacterized protein (TIGR02147 family)
MDLYRRLDYRTVLKEFYEESKKKDPKYSFRVFAQKAGFKSKAYLIEVISKKKALSKNSIFQVTRAMGLNLREGDYFETLVRFNEAKSIAEREYNLHRLMALAGKTKAALLGGEVYGYFSEWFHPAVRELAAMAGFKKDWAALAEAVRPAITPPQARNSVELLVRLGLLKKAGNGRYALGQRHVSTADEISSLAVARYQQKTMALATEALERFPPEVREISTLTAGLSETCFKSLKKEIQLFRKQLVQLVEADTGADRVYQINFQLFPLSALPEKKNGPK